MNGLLLFSYSIWSSPSKFLLIHRRFSMIGLKLIMKIERVQWLISYNSSYNAVDVKVKQCFDTVCYFFRAYYLELVCRNWGILCLCGIFVCVVFSMNPVFCRSPWRINEELNCCKLNVAFSRPSLILFFLKYTFVYWQEKYQGRWLKLKKLCMQLDNSLKHSMKKVMNIP